MNYIIREILKEYEFSGKIKEKNVDETFNKKLKLKERIKKRDLKFTESFS